MQKTCIPLLSIHRTYVIVFPEISKPCVGAGGEEFAADNFETQTNERWTRGWEGCSSHGDLIAQS